MWPFKKKKEEKPRRTLSPSGKYAQKPTPTPKATATRKATSAAPAHDSTTPFIMGMMLGGDDSPSKSNHSNHNVSSYDHGSHSHDSGGSYDGGGSDGGGGGD